MRPFKEYIRGGRLFLVALLCPTLSACLPACLPASQPASLPVLSCVCYHVLCMCVAVITLLLYYHIIERQCDNVIYYHIITLFFMPFQVSNPEETATNF